ncbi:16S rRNA pseudouridine(516) synthase [Parendozoicomonas sp. Alg238-R29]|uniref:pseudouridine synthase n=1 Tax=Parendozoicomonas sp. Alg238-R29 TaxID=2993446 RepID=UPI00248D824E|nr:16S rRNA pseudouridine(516) synthase [Parendozoicomonas sp. Alg238-R29]
MALNRSRLDRFLSTTINISRRDTRILFAQGRVQVDGRTASDGNQQIDRFTCITFDGTILQDNKPRYLMLHKPVGVVSATRDTEHRTALEILNEPENSDLHIAGRLDLNTSGLLLLTNDSRWSSRLTAPDHKVEKRYRVTLQKPLNDSYVKAFNQGMYFEFENLTTRPAGFKQLSLFVAEITLQEGRYHQIKRMFGRFRNPVLALHRISVGKIQLCPTLSPGQYRELTSEEVSHIQGFAAHTRFL